MLVHPRTPYYGAIPRTSTVYPLSLLLDPLPFALFPSPRRKSPDSQGSLGIPLPLSPLLLGDPQNSVTPLSKTVNTWKVFWTPLDVVGGPPPVRRRAKEDSCIELCGPLVPLAAPGKSRGRGAILQGAAQQCGTMLMTPYRILDTARVPQQCGTMLIITLYRI